MGQLLFKKALPHVVAILTFLVVNIAYFNAQLNGEVVQSSDIVSYLGMAEEARAYKELSGEATLWTNSMFGGMPIYTCLLYTSPSPRDQRGSRMPSSA